MIASSKPSPADMPRPLIREVTVHGSVFAVPQRIVRLDGAKVRGWQVRYLGTKLFSDGVAGPARSLAASVAELQRRYAIQPPPVSYKPRTCNRRDKGNEAPPGISGPIWYQKPSGLAFARYNVVLAQSDRRKRVASVYIGNVNTYTVARDDAALEEAVRIRQEAVALCSDERRSQFGAGPARPVAVQLHP